MEFLIPSFLAGVLTVIAPCALALLPVILGGSVADSEKKDPFRPLIITLSLGVSVILFTLLLKATTAFIGIPQSVWTWISGGLITIFGLTMVFPSAWDKIAFKLKLYKSESLMVKSQNKKGAAGTILLGASLGPVFTTCSPTYAIIIATVLPQSFGIGFLNLIVYTIGLMIPLLLIGYGGRRVAQKFKAASNPNGWFKKTLGILLIVVGFLIITGLDKELETLILDSGYLGPIGIEESLLENARN